jgi:DNA-binding protein YbaB
MEQLHAWKGRIDKLAADTQAMSNAMQDLRVTVADDNGLAQVTVDSAGLLLDLKLSQKVQRVAPEVTARTIMETIRKARTQVANRSREIIAETLGTESEAARESPSASVSGCSHPTTRRPPPATRATGSGADEHRVEGGPQPDPGPR